MKISHKKTERSDYSHCTADGVSQMTVGTHLLLHCILGSGVTFAVISLLHGRPQKFFQEGGNVDILLILFRFLAMQCKWTYTKCFTFSTPQIKCSMLRQRLQIVLPLGQPCPTCGPVEGLVWPSLVFTIVKVSCILTTCPCLIILNLTFLMQVVLSATL